MLAKTAIPLTQGEKDVLALMSRLGVTIREIKDAVQHLRIADMKRVEDYLIKSRR